MNGMTSSIEQKGLRYAVFACVAHSKDEGYPVAIEVGYLNELALHLIPEKEIVPI